MGLLQSLYIHSANKSLVLTGSGGILDQWKRGEGLYFSQMSLRGHPLVPQWTWWLEGGRAWTGTHLLPVLFVSHRWTVSSRWCSVWAASTHWQWSASPATSKDATRAEVINICIYVAGFWLVRSLIDVGQTSHYIHDITLKPVKLYVVVWLHLRLCRGKLTFLVKIMTSCWGFCLLSELSSGH